MMIARVERISRMNGVTKKVSAYGQRQGYADSNGGSGFERELQSAMQVKKDTRVQSEPVIGQPYLLSVTRVTQSLFYQNEMLSDRLEEYLHGIG